MLTKRDSVMARGRTPHSRRLSLTIHVLDIRVVQLLYSGYCRLEVGVIWPYRPLIVVPIVLNGSGASVHAYQDCKDTQKPEEFQAVASSDLSSVFPRRVIQFSRRIRGRRICVRRTRGRRPYSEGIHSVGKPGRPVVFREKTSFRHYPASQNATKRSISIVGYYPRHELSSRYRRTVSLFGTRTSRRRRLERLPL